MEHIILYAGFAVAAWLLLIGLYGIVTSSNLVHLCLCLAVLQASTYVLLTVIGFRPGLPAPVFVDGVKPGSPAVDPVIQALMLTDIVVEATVVALLLALTVKLHRKTGSADPNRVNLMKG
ncbi:MAG TPA: cation:proton antiporter subunit C [Tepidisphaeraceae bacterium]|nr:cation:proton antiporter subunit C [Tepidisphaeraceae bacterium]